MVTGKINELRKLAEPLVPWCVTSAWEGEEGTAWLGNISYDDNLHEVACFDLTMYDGFEGDSLKMAQYYAAANPAAILALIAEIDSLRDQVNGLTGELGRERKRLDWALKHDSFYDHTTGVFFCDPAFKIPQPQVRIETDNFRATIDELDQAYDQAADMKVLQGTKVRIA